MTAIKPEQIRWRVGSTSKDKSKGMLLGYIDSRTAMEFLDEKDASWSDEYEIVSLDGSQGVQCALTVNGVTRTDVGVPSNTEGLKGAYSDALKRAAVKHGIGRELYELPRIWVALDNYGRPTAEPAFVKGRWTLPQGAGSVFYDHEPTDTPQRDGQSAAASRPVAGGAKAVPPQPSPAPDDDPYADAPPMFDSDPDELVREVERVTSGREIPTDLTERIARAEQKGQPKESECPVHHKAKVNKRGLYCPTNMGTRDEPQWCDWSAAA